MGDAGATVSHAVRQCFLLQLAHTADRVPLVASCRLVSAQAIRCSLLYTGNMLCIPLQDSNGMLTPVTTHQ